MSSIKDGLPVEKMRQEMGIMNITEVTRMGRSRWFGHLRREESGWVSRCKDMEIKCGKPKGCSKLTCRQVMRQVLKLMGMEEAEDRELERFRMDCMRYWRT